MSPTQDMSASAPLQDNVLTTCNEKKVIEHARNIIECKQKKIVIIPQLVIFRFFLGTGN